MMIVSIYAVAKVAAVAGNLAERSFTSKRIDRVYAAPFRHPWKTFEKKMEGHCQGHLFQTSRYPTHI